MNSTSSPAMTSAQTRIFITRWMGGFENNLKLLPQHRDPTDFELSQCGIPDFERDLNDIRRAVAKLSDEQYVVFQRNLVTICGFDPDLGWEYRDVQEASAEQRTQALVRTIQESPVVA